MNETPDGEVPSGRCDANKEERHGNGETDDL